MSDIHLYALCDEGPRRLATPAGIHTLHDLEEPDGIYEGLRTFGRARFLFLDRHLARAQRSMTALGWSEPLDEKLLRRGLDQVEAIASAGTRVRRLSFGAGDFTLDMGMRWTLDEGELDYARSRIVLASRAARLEPPVATVFIHIREHEAFRASCDRVIERIIGEEHPLAPAEAAAVALYARYLKRINAHLTNTVSSVVNPFHRIGYNEKKKKKAEPPAE